MRFRSSARWNLGHFFDLCKTDSGFPDHLSKRKRGIEGSIPRSSVSCGDLPEAPGSLGAGWTGGLLTNQVTGNSQRLLTEPLSLSHLTGSYVSFFHLDHLLSQRKRILRRFPRRCQGEIRTYRRCSFLCRRETGVIDSVRQLLLDAATLSTLFLISLTEAENDACRDSTAFTFGSSHAHHKVISLENSESDSIGCFHVQAATQSHSEPEISLR